MTTSALYDAPPTSKEVVFSVGTLAVNVDSESLVERATSKLGGFGMESKATFILPEVSAAILRQFVPSKAKLAAPIIVVVGLDKVSPKATAEGNFPLKDDSVDSEDLVDKATSKLGGLATDSTTVLSLLEVSVASLLQYVPSQPKLAAPIIVVVGFAKLSAKAAADGNLPEKALSVASLDLVDRATSRFGGLATVSTTVLSLLEESAAILRQFVPSNPKRAEPTIVVVGFARASPKAAADGNFPLKEVMSASRSVSVLLPVPLMASLSVVRDISSLSSCPLT
jgi:hypothetical protein